MDLPAAWAGGFSKQAPPIREWSVEQVLQRHFIPFQPDGRDLLQGLWRKLATDFFSRAGNLLLLQDLAQFVR